jgi:hypothetical protein
VPRRARRSTLAQRLLATDGVPWLPTDVVRTVLRRVLPELEAERFLIEGFELAPTYPARLQAAVEGIRVRDETAVPR